MRIVFLGSDSLACPSLEALLRAGKDEIAGVVTQPDRPSGRHRQLTPSPVKRAMEGRGLPVLTPENVNAPESVEALRALRPDLLVVVAYGQILKAEILTAAPRGCVNVHPSLLPKYRGAAPIAWAIVRGESVTGVTTMVVNERMDAGDMLLRREVAIEADDTGGTLHDRLALVGADLLVSTLEAIRNGTARGIPQNDAEATFAPKLKKSDGRIDWGQPADEICRRVRGFHPWPGCACEVPRGSGALLRVLRAAVDPTEGPAPGTVREAGSNLVVQAGRGAVRLLEVQPEGKKPMSAEVFLRGHRLQPGDKVG